MKRRKIIKISSGAMMALPSCSAQKNVVDPASGQQVPVKVGANTQYHTPAYANQSLRNPNIQLPSSFSGTQVTHTRGPSTHPYVAMTFDDGPHPKNTPRLLDMLRARNIRATFYVIGKNVDRYPEIVRRIVAEGHEIGNHTYTHRNLKSLNAAQVREEMQKTQDAIVRAAGVKPRTMRPPYGSLYTKQRATIFNEFGYPTIMWSVDPNDWKRPGASVVTSRILNGADNGAIILAHDLHAPTVDAMPATFDGLLKRGFQFITVSQMLTLKG